jgi:hypothetical protein
MRRKLICVSIFAAIAAGASVYVGTALATPASGFSATTLAVGHFAEIDATNLMVLEPPAGGSSHGHQPNNAWLSLQKTKGPSDLYVQSNVWAPGGSTGWHTHPGHSLIVVTAGTLTAYHADDPDCTPHVYTVGMGFVDEGGDHVHLIRNEDALDEARNIAVQLIPSGATRRIDAPAPVTCGF